MRIRRKDIQICSPVQGKRQIEGKSSDEKSKTKNKHSRNTHRFKELKLDPSALKHLKNKWLSPIVRANIALNKSPAKLGKNKQNLDLSSENSLEKMHLKDDEMIDFKNDNIYTIFSSSKSSTHNGDDQALLKIIEKDSLNILGWGSPTNTKYTKHINNPEAETERAHSNSKSPMKSLQPTINKIRSNKKIIDEFYK